VAKNRALIVVGLPGDGEHVDILSRPRRL
jgi:hypothetical protein